MDILEKIPEPIKQYWPYILGAVIGLYLIMRYSGGSSTGDFLAAQTQGAALNAQSAAQMAQIQAVRDVEMGKVNVQGQVAHLNAQAGLAEAVGIATREITTSLYAPSIAAIGAATYENAVAIQSASEVAAHAYAAQASIAESTAKSASSFYESQGTAWANIGQGMGRILGG